MADTVGEAVDIAWTSVKAAADTMIADFSLWDLRILPRSAILDRRA
jgi:hypothetical protein